MKRNVFTTNTLDAETGEVVSKQWITKESKTAAQFVKLYLEDVSALYGLSNSDFRTLHALAEFLEYNTNNFFLNKERRIELATKAHTTHNNLNQCISRLVRKNLLIKIGACNYQMNPKLFFNGDEIERSKYLEIVLRYNITKS